MTAKESSSLLVFMTLSSLSNDTIESKEVNIDKKVTRRCGSGEIALLVMQAYHKDAMKLTADCTSNFSIKYV